MIIGVTGGIGSGKSTACKILNDLIPNSVILNFDETIIELYEHPKIKRNLLGKYGVNKKKDIKLLIDSPNFLFELNEIFKPELIGKIGIFINQNFNKNMIFDCPLLFENYIHYVCQLTLSISVPESLRYHRVNKRCKMQYDIFEIIKNSQFDERIRNDKADWVIKNSTGTDDLANELQAFVEYNL